MVEDVVCVFGVDCCFEFVLLGICLGVGLDDCGLCGFVVVVE